MIHTDTATARAYVQPEQLKRQSVMIPSHFFGRRSGSYSMITRTVTALGTVETHRSAYYLNGKDDHGRRGSRVPYGFVLHARDKYLVIQNGCTWEAIEKKGK